MPGYDLKAAVNKVQAKPLNFALYRGGDANQVLITSTPASAKQIAEIEKECGPTKRLVKGICFWEEGKLVFASKTAPAVAWELLITKVFKDNKCSSFLPVILRKLGDHESDEVHATEEGAETAPGETIPVAPPPPAPPAPPGAPSSDAAAQFATRLKALKPRIDQTIAAGTPQSEEVKLRLSELGYFARKQDFAQAGGVLDQIERLLGPAASPAPPPAPPPPPPMATAPKPPAPPPAPPGPGAAPPDFMARLKELKPQIDQAIAAKGPAADELKLRFSEVAALARKQDFVNAGGVLDAIEKLLKSPGEAPVAPSPRASQPGASDGIVKGLVAYRKALLEFAAAKSQVAAQIAALRSAIPKAMPQEQELADEAAETLNEYNDSLGDLIDEAINMSKDDREPYNDAVRQEIDDYIADLGANELIRHIDTNRFAPTTIATTLTAALTKIAKAIV